MKTFSRPTALGMAFVNAATKAKAQHSPIARYVVELVDRNDRPYNRVEHDGIRVSQEVLDQCFHYTE